MNMCCRECFLDLIISLFRTSLHPSIMATDQASHMKYDRQLDARSMVQDIKTLQVKFDTTKDEDEQRALEEDVTGKVLWFFWCGICAEVDELLPKVVDYIRREGSIKVSGIPRLNIVVTAFSRV
ncbi:hypothetical protein EDD16DRAFT_986351 [Pisolithus croceorrhizus]|nr:hypothetical protein EDD16DRAFT_986351 [Pisolithus croceorrhizus]